MVNADPENVMRQSRAANAAYVVEQVRARGEDADDFDRRAGDRDRAAKHAPVAAELALPEPVIEHGYAAMARLILAGHQGPSERDGES